MTQIKLIFNDSADFYDEHLMRVLFPLIANVLDDCANSRDEGIKIPFAKGEFDALFETCLNYLRSRDGEMIAERELHDYLLCELMERDKNETMECYFARNNWFELLKLRFEIGFSVVNRENLCSCAAKQGNIEILRWLRAHDCECGVDACISAASAGHLDVLCWIVSNGWTPNSEHPLQDERKCANAAAKNGHIEILEWIRTHWFDWGHQDMPLLFRTKRANAELCESAASGGQLDTLKYLRAKGCPWDIRVASSAAFYGHIEILKWYLSNGGTWDTQVCSLAAANCQLETLQWLRANEYGTCPWGASTCWRAARNGHLGVLKWAHENGCPWDEWTCENAVLKEHFEVLKWLRANGWPWNKQKCLHRAKTSEVREWIMAQPD